MPVCVHCAHPVPTLLTTFGSGHVILTRCGWDEKAENGCGRIADPYLEQDGMSLFVDLVCSVANGDARQTARLSPSSLQSGHGECKARQSQYNTEILDAYASLPSYGSCGELSPLVRIMCVDGTYAGVYPEPTKKQPFAALSEEQKPFPFLLINQVSYLPPTLRSIVRVTIATAIEVVALHLAVIVVTSIIFRIWSHIRPSPLVACYSWHLPSVALLFASISSSVLLTFLLVWEPHLPHFAHSKRCINAQPEHEPCDTLHRSSNPSIATVQTLTSTLNTQWLVRNLIGGMSAGVALGTVLPIHPFAGIFTLLLGTWFQNFIRNTVIQLPALHTATYLLQNGSIATRRTVAAYCQP